jgi:hypothetical protein
LRKNVSLGSAVSENRCARYVVRRGEGNFDPTFLLALERRRIAAHPKKRLRRFSKRNYSRDLRSAKWGSAVILQGNNLEPPMSALGQKQTCRFQLAMSALPPKAGIGGHHFDVR